MKRKRIAIIGFGPRGLSLLERIIACTKNLTEFSDSLLDIHIFDTQLPGSGCHDTNQPEYLLVNTVANQITQFSDHSVQDAGPLLSGPSFFEWMRDYKNTTFMPLELSTIGQLLKRNKNNRTVSPDDDGISVHGLLSQCVCRESTPRKLGIYHSLC